MTYVRDGDIFALFGASPADRLVAVGWLEDGMSYPVGVIEPEAVRRLRDLCREGVNRTRGFHRCTLCGDYELATGPLIVESESGPFPVGSAEVRVRSPTGVRYSAPDMIIHYVEAHQYRPPDDFIAAVLNAGQSRPSSRTE
jgi:hypothetical protein